MKPLYRKRVAHKPRASVKTNGTSGTKYRKSDLPEPPSFESGKEELGFDVAHMQSVVHNAVMWCNRTGRITARHSHPFSSALTMEQNDSSVQATFSFMTSPYSNGNLSLTVWSDGEVVLQVADHPGPVYRYPSKNLKVRNFKPGKWEKFLTSKEYKA